MVLWHTVLIQSKINYSPETVLVANRQATARNIADSAVTRLQPISNTCNQSLWSTPQAKVQRCGSCARSRDFPRNFRFPADQ